MLRRFPRPKGRGRIEAACIARLEDGYHAVFHGRKAVAELKARSPVGE